jgi:ABC-type branched-subunit amino acid transport system substrate-binding protein
MSIQVYRRLKLAIVAFTLLTKITTPSIADPAAQDTARYKIGIAIPLTGDFSAYGIAVEHGIEIAKNKFSKEFSNLEIIVEDNKYEAVATLNAFRKFQSEDISMVYSWGEHPFAVLAPVAQRAKVPLLAMSVDIRPGLNQSYLLRTINNPTELVGPVLIELRKGGAKNYAIIQNEDPFLTSCTNAFRSSLSSDETLTILGTVQTNETDFKSLALKLTKTNYDAIGVYLSPGQVSNFYKQLEVFKINTPTFGTDIFESTTEVNAAGPIMNGAIYPTLATPDWFSAEYKKHSANDSEMPYGYNGYAFAAITAKILNSSPTVLSAEQILERYKSIAVNDVEVDYHYVENSQGDRYLSFPITVKKIADGKFTVLQ